MKPIDKLHYKFADWANLRIHGLSWIVRMMQRRALNHTSVVILRCTGNPLPCTHIDFKTVNHAEFNHFQAHRGILATCHMSWVSFWYITHCRFNILIWQYSMSQPYWIAVSKYETLTWLIPGKLKLLLPFVSSSGAPGNYQHIVWVVLWQIQHR
jgi:hypothetical protein